MQAPFRKKQIGNISTISIYKLEIEYDINRSDLKLLLNPVI